MIPLKIKTRTIFEGVEISNEVIKPVAEKWVDGLVHQTDTLQLTLKSKNDKPVHELEAYLYYFDSNSKELGHEYDIDNTVLQNGSEARMSLMLLPPARTSYSNLEIKAEYKKKDYSAIKFYLLIAGLTGLFINELFSRP